MLSRGRVQPAEYANRRGCAWLWGTRGTQQMGFENVVRTDYVSGSHTHVAAADRSCYCIDAEPEHNVARA